MSCDRRRALAALVGLTLMACSSADEDEQPQVLTPQDGEVEALTYNVAGLPQGLSGSDPEAHMPLISPLLNGYELVLVQEDFSYHSELAEEAEHPHQSVPKEDSLRFVHDGLNRFSQWPWSSLQRTQWVACFGDATSGASDCLAEKGFSLARTDLGEGVIVDIYNHHAEAGGGSEDVAARTEGYDQFIAYIQEHSAGSALIVGGDMNLHGDDPDDAPILQRFKDEAGLTDVCEYLSCGDDHIDRFLFRDNDLIDIEPLMWEVAAEFVDGEGNDLSDHEAIHVTFSWQTK